MKSPVAILRESRWTSTTAWRQSDGPMDNLELLADDHLVLSSQVLHVVALLGALVEGRFAAAPLYSEIVRQTDLLYVQLVEHFEFEEITAFPPLKEQFPALAPRLQTFLNQHDRILEAFKEMRSELELGELHLVHSNALLRTAQFESAFEQHATAETKLFKEMANHVRERVRRE